MAGAKQSRRERLWQIDLDQRPLGIAQIRLATLRNSLVLRAGGWGPHQESGLPEQPLEHINFRRPTPFKTAS